MIQKAKAVDSYIRKKNNQDKCVGFIDGYEKCQEDMIDKKYTEDDIKETAYFFATYKMAANQSIFDKDIHSFIDYLNKQK